VERICHVTSLSISSEEDIHHFVSAWWEFSDRALVEIRMSPVVADISGIAALSCGSLSQRDILLVEETFSMVDFIWGCIV
jgi:hypothetical protein